VLASVAALVVLGGAGLHYGRRWAAGGNPLPRPPVTNSLGMQLAWVPAGTFTMGSPSDEADRRADEGPPHEVTLSRPFYLAVHQTTVAQFRAFVQATRYQTEAEKAAEANAAGIWRNPGWTPDDDEPVVCVSRYDALAFCYWLGRKEGKNYRLPTEAEWEYCCRGGPAAVCSGQLAVGSGEHPLPTAHCPLPTGPPARVGSFRPNAWGLHDMHGNVWQWCADVYSPTYYRDSPGRDPRGPEGGELGVLRGGSWRSGPADCRCAARLGVALGSSRPDAGFRVVLEAGVR
jgi:formylglycine-generating enzyme required for sulfatase activity